MPAEPTTSAMPSEPDLPDLPAMPSEPDLPAMPSEPDLPDPQPLPPQARICCLDLDTFFVSVERLLDPSLVGKPVVVGAMPGQRGVVTAASYEVRVFGVHSGMPIRDAVRRAPHAVFVPGRHGTYTPYARRVRAVIDRFAPIVQTASIDEFFLDLRGCERLYRREGDRDDDATIERVAHELRDVIQTEIGLPASVGIGSSRTIAKVASGRAKPAGVCLVAAGRERAFLAPLPVRKLPGIGPVAEDHLNDAGVLTLGQLLDLPPGPSRNRFRGLRKRLQGIVDATGGSSVLRDRPAFLEHDPIGSDEGSISNERTFRVDVGDRRGIEDQLRGLCERVSWRARRRGVLARTISLKLRYADFETLGRSRTIVATDNDGRVYDCARKLLAAVLDPKRPVRLLGIALSNLEVADRQLGLPFAGRDRARVGAAVDAVRDRFGYDAIRLGVAGGRSDWIA